ncbi:MAG TPA: hypothetical protein RMH99_07355 [Sandaracinaceae bacterium LLY-WYZ-13_1]|nr:hypothetical protein [Sandaracinaceae bacterium LLY-WYZ-13_1]
MRAGTAVAVGLALLALGCSLVNDPSEHTQGRDGGSTPDAGGGVDAGPIDAGPPDAGPPDAGPADAGPPPIEMDEFCETFASAYCEAVPVCCDAVDEAPTDCVSDLVTACNDQLGEAFTDGRITYDGARARLSLLEGRELVGRCSPDIQEWLTRRDGFFYAFVGTVSGGDSCEPLAGGGPGIAEALTMCADPSQSCRDAGGTKRCLTRGAIGDDCGAALQCMEGLRCVRDMNATILTRATCDTGEPTGSPCITSDECQSLNCVGSGWFVEGTCAPLDQQSVYCPE